MPIQLIFQILQLESCNTDTDDAKLEIIAKQFCNFSFAERAYKSYLLGITFLRYLDVYKFIYKVCFMCLLFFAILCIRGGEDPWDKQPILKGYINLMGLDNFVVQHDWN